MKSLNSTYAIFSLLMLFAFAARSQFQLNGTASHSGAGNYLLTPAAGAKVGSIWYNDKISLNESFDLDFELYFGTKDNGADGISFCLQPVSTSIGVSGGGLGVGGVNPSFFAEFDTYRNGGDPNFDHVALQKNGDVYNTGANNLAPAVQIKNGVNNVENGQWYPMQVKWDADQKLFEIYVDCVLRISYTGDIVNTIFGGDPMVYWGFTASTGGANNEHRVRNVRTNLIKIPNQEICANQNIQIQLPPTSSGFNWFPTIGIDDVNSLTPTFSPSQTTEYIVTYNGFCNSQLKDTFTVAVSSADTELINDTTICEGEAIDLDAGNGQSHLWNTGETSQTINVSTAGTYSVEVENVNGCVSNAEVVIGVEVCECVDTDQDGVCDVDDLDDDNDGILDQDECPSNFVSQAFSTSGGTTTTFNAPSADEGFQFDVFTLDNSFNLEINGVKLVPNELQFQNTNSPNESFLRFTADGTGFGESGNAQIWTLTGDAASPIIRVQINNQGGVQVFGKRSTGAELEPMSISDPGQDFNRVSWNVSAQNSVVLSQKVVGPTSISGIGYGVQLCKEDTDGDGIINSLDTDSDGDGCLDAIEGGSSFTEEDIANGELLGGVDADGIPLVVGSNGQTVGTSSNSNLVDQVCLVELIETDTLYICSGDSINIGYNSEALGEWQGSEPFNEMGDDSITVRPTTTAYYYYKSFTKNQNMLVNGNFEQPFKGGFAFVNANEVPGWNTTATDNMMEFWPNGMLGTPAFSGQQFVELNANMQSALYQDIVTTPGDQLQWGFAHRGRNGVETAEFQVGPPGGPYQTIGAFSDNNTAWGYYNGIYKIPAGQTTTRFYFSSNDPGASGNLLDAIEFYTLNVQTDSVLVIVKEAPQVNLGNDTTICEGNEVVLNAGIAAAYLWSTNEESQKINVESAGNYYVQATHANGCSAFDTLSLSINLMPTVNLGNDTSICFGESVSLTAQNNNFNYNWSTGETSQTISRDETGTISIIVSDDIGCSDQDTIHITVQNLPVVKLGNDTTICEGESIELDAENRGLMYTWNTGDDVQTITIQQSGVYGIEVTNEIGCLGSDSMELVVNKLPQVYLGKDTTICIGESVILNAQNNNFNYNWSTGKTTQSITISESGTFGVMVSDEMGCSDSDSLALTVNPLPIVQLGNDTTICKYQTVVLDAQNKDLNFIWNTGSTSQTISVNTEGFYSVAVTDEIGCLGSDEIFVSKEIIPDPFSEKEKNVCEGTSILLEADTGYEEYTVFWSTDLNNSTLEVTENGEYNSIVQSEFCKDTFTIEVTKIDTPDVVVTDLRGLDHYCFELESTVLNISSDDERSVTYNWEDFGETDEVEITDSGTYIVVASNGFCSAIYTHHIEEFCAGNLFVPNAFTPDGDGLNDIFLPVSNGHIESYEFRVFNRWGDEIFFTSNQDEGWDGRLKNNIIQIDVYVYKITYDALSEYGGMERKEIIGSVTLLK